MKQTHIALAAALMVNALPVLAEDAAPTPPAPSEYTLLDAIKTGKPMTSFRLRYEDVSQDGLGPANTSAANNDLQDGKGTTLRSLIGWQTAPFHNFSFAAQLIDVSKFQDDYNDSTNGTLINGVSNQPDKVKYAKIVDPDYTGVNQLYLDWTGIKNTRLRIGRQQVNLDNVRFVGDIGFRQVMQVFDGESLLNKSLPDTQIFLAHFNRVRQITTVLRDDGSLNIANVKYSISPTESVVGYAYLSSFEDLGLGRGWFGNAAT
ncbi:alginate export family protein, partial [Novimethylophilus kurashikiensis]